MWVNVLLLGVSSALFAYWFRYSCILILSIRKARDYAAAVARANALEFPEVQRILNELNTADPNHLDALHRALHRDYEFLTSLIRHSADFHGVGHAVENRMILVDYHLMSAWYALCRRISAPKGREALEEMAQILRHLAETIGELSARQFAAA
jgi:hypothetical protein